ncbi:MAG: hypothetical protein CME65_01310 [Halobacteriovoraceae bacterium]|nr:hypothetical protein [Halobacteriovoraceae bacterium]|tara:strand:+ start:2765 stop:3745 length:981 start_codon:yes stop_codon:yes gene_type:complete
MKYLNTFLVAGVLSINFNMAFAQKACENPSGLNSQEQEVIDLIRSATAINEPILMATERHSERIIEFMRQISDMPYSDMQMAPILFLNLVASLADSADDNRLMVSMDEQMSLINEFSRIFLGAPNFVDTLEPAARVQVQKIIDSVETIEISHRTRGRYRGEARLKIHNRNNKDLKINFEEIGRLTGMDMPLEELIIEDNAEIIFNDSELDYRGRRSRDNRIVDLVENATTRDFGGTRLINENQVNRTLAIIENQEYRRDNQPVYFRAEGIRVKSEYLGLGGKVSQGVVIPHIIQDSNGEAPSSMFLQIKATGMLGLASIAGATVAL